MNKNKTNKKYVEKFIHPLVERKIIDETKLSKSPLVVEIPLLFPAKLEYLCKYIIVITTSKDKQIERVKLRGSNVDLLKLNDSFFYNEDKNVYVINNDKDEKNLYNEVDKILAKINK